MGEAPVTRSFLYNAVSVFITGLTLLEIRFVRVKKGPKVSGIEDLRLRDTGVQITTAPITTVMPTATSPPSTTMTTYNGIYDGCHCDHILRPNTLCATSQGRQNVSPVCARRRGACGR